MAKLFCIHGRNLRETGNNPDAHCQEIMYLDCLFTQWNTI